MLIMLLTEWEEERNIVFILQTPITNGDNQQFGFNSTLNELYPNRGSIRIRNSFATLPINWKNE